MLFRSRHNLYNHIELTIRNAETAVSIMTTDQGFLRKAGGLKSTFEKLNKKGVQIKIAAPITKDSKDALKELSGIAEVRHSDPHNGRFVLVDNKDVIFMVSDDKEVHPTYDVGIWVKSPFFVNALNDLFENAWKGMKKA